MGCMAAQLIYEISCNEVNTLTLIELAGDPPVTAAARPWLQWRFTDPLLAAGPATPVEPGVRFWRRGTAPGDDANLVLRWLRDNTLAEQSGIDTDMLVQLFIEAAVNGPGGSTSCDGEYLATISGTTSWVGTAADSRWSLAANLSAETTEAVLGAIADSGPRWRYAIVAARDSDSPAGLVRQRLLDDLGR